MSKPREWRGTLRVFIYRDGTKPLTYSTSWPYCPSKDGFDDGTGGIAHGCDHTVTAPTRAQAHRVAVEEHRRNCRRDEPRT